MKFQIDINCDLGESYGAFKVGNDEMIMPHITSANIACGFHAGDPVTIAHTINLAKKYNVAIGAHPSYPDLLGFGRREMKLTPEEVRNYVIYQISALQGFATTVGTSLQHVKLHGALYNTAAEDSKTSKAVIEAVKELNPNLIIFAPPNSALANAASHAELKVAHEFFADRAYNPDGSLVSRKEPNSIIQERQKVVERTVKAVKEQRVIAVNGDIINIGKIHTICVHGDTPTAVELVSALKKELVKAGIEVKPVGSFL
ncbi:MAG: 5-oxoprolinase subunit PxpA [Candidatus Bathyarchaeia archaeon]